MVENDQSQIHDVNSTNGSIELLIDKKISDAKLVVAEKRLHYLLTISAFLFTIFGIILPIFQSQQEAKRVDQAINRMERKFEELAGMELRKPKISAFIDGKTLENKLLTFNFSSADKKNNATLCKQIIIKNIGDGTTEDITLKVYSSKRNFFHLHFPARGLFKQLNSYDEKQFEVVYRFVKEPFKLAAQDIFVINLSVDWRNIEQLETKEANAILKIYYGEPFPKEIPFNITIDAQGNE